MSEKFLEDMKFIRIMLVIDYIKENKDTEFPNIGEYLLENI